MKKILSSLLMLALVASGVTLSTRAYFSDSELTDDNVFQAGRLDLTVDFDDTYYGAGDPVHTVWAAHDLTGGERFWDLDDVKPGDHGNGWISLHLNDNPAWARVNIFNVLNNENQCTEPEATVDTTCSAVGDPGLGLGELAQNMTWNIWVDANHDGVQDVGETVLYSGTAAAIVGAGTLQLPITSSPLPAGDTYLGYSWSVDSSVGNVIQSDSLQADISFDVVQSRHNPTPVWP